MNFFLTSSRFPISLIAHIQLHNFPRLEKSIRHLLSIYYESLLLPLKLSWFHMNNNKVSSLPYHYVLIAEMVGFEPTNRISAIDCFQDNWFQPLTPHLQTRLPYLLPGSLWKIKLKTPISNHWQKYHQQKVSNQPLIHYLQSSCKE